MALFGGMFGGGGVQKHSNLDQLSLAIHNCLNLQLVPPDGDVLSAIEAMTHLDLVGFQNAHNIEGMQELFRAKSLRTTIDPSAHTLTLSTASPEEIDLELKAEHSAVKVLHVGEHRGTARIIRPISPTVAPIQPATPPPTAPSAAPQPEAVTIPPAFEHLEAVERLCPVLVDTFVKYGQLTTADKEVLKKIKPIDYTLEARLVALERWKAELSRRSRGIHVQQTGSSSLLASAASSQKSEEDLMRRFDMLLHWLGKLIKALEHKGCKFQAKPVWLPH
jgi:hypothetical protein